MERIFIGSNNKATIICKKCKKDRSLDVSKLGARAQKEIKIKYRCPCGYSDIICLEKRQHYRKTTNLPGTYYRYNVNGEKGIENVMTVKDVSHGGINLQIGMHKLGNIKIGDKILVEFKLDNSRKSLISRDAFITYKGKFNLGAEFCSKDLADGLGFYLMSYKNE